MRTDRHQADKEKWESLEFDRRRLTTMALDCAEDLSGGELDEFLDALPKVIRDEAVFQLMPRHR